MIRAMSESSLVHASLQLPLMAAADGLYQSSERLVQQLDFAAQAVMHAVTSGGKVLCAGHAEAATLAEQTACLLVHGHGRERPPLAAVAVQPRPGQTDLTAGLRALGHPGDVWLAFSLERTEPELRAATELAAELDLTLIAFTGESARTLGALLRDTDVWVPLPGGDRPDTLYAMAWLALHGLVTAVDTHLLGDAP
jgi:D-sedoheptulose 7-phosphate isomerase